MRYIIISILLLFFVGCGGNSLSDENPPASPQSKDSKNIPPSIPKI
jgi:hypothetical protein